MWWFPRKLKVEDSILVRSFIGTHLDVAGRLHNGVLKLEQETDYAMLTYLTGTDFTYVSNRKQPPGLFIPTAAQMFSHLIRSRRFTHDERKLLQRGHAIGATFNADSDCVCELRGVTEADAIRFAELMNHVLNTQSWIVSPNNHKKIEKRIFS